MAEGGKSCHEESFDSSMFQSKFIHCCATSMYPYTNYSTTLDSFHIDFSIDMEINKDFLGESRNRYGPAPSSFSASPPLLNPVVPVRPTSSSSPPSTSPGTRSAKICPSNQSRNRIRPPHQLHPCCCHW